MGVSFGDRVAVLATAATVVVDQCIGGTLDQTDATVLTLPNNYDKLLVLIDQFKNVSLKYVDLYGKYTRDIK